MVRWVRTGVCTIMGLPWESDGDLGCPRARACPGKWNWALPVCDGRPGVWTLAGETRVPQTRSAALRTSAAASSMP